MLLTTEFHRRVTSGLYPGVDLPAGLLTGEDLHDLSKIRQDLKSRLYDVFKAVKLGADQYKVVMENKKARSRRGVRRRDVSTTYVLSSYR